MRTERYELDEWTRWQDNRIYDGSYFFYPTGIEEALSGTAMPIWRGIWKKGDTTKIRFIS